MEIKISQKTLEILRDIITGDNMLSPYKSGPELVKFFNSIGFNDEYSQGFPSRWNYVEAKLNELNKQGRIGDVLYAYFSPINFIEEENLLNELINLLNKYIEIDKYKLEIKGKKLKIVSVVDEIVEGGELYSLNSEVIKENIEKCDKKIKENDYTGAITNARTFLETLLLYIHKNIKNEDYNFKGDLPRLYKDVSGLVKLNIEKNTEDDIKRVLSGLTSIVSGISGISNKMADRPGRLIEYDKEIQRNLSILAVNSVKTLSLYLYSCYEKIRR
jgi:hypothetical protein